jgi:polyphosphate kinase
VPGLSERIRVRSILGRFLEHSRMYRFGSEARGRTYLIGSADLMPRNLDKRIEVLVPIDEPPLVARLEEVLELLLSDDGAWELAGDGTWSRVSRGARQVGVQRALRERARARCSAE